MRPVTTEAQMTDTPDHPLDGRGGAPGAMSCEAPPRCGDLVLHRPSGETWVIAYADPVQDVIAWAGWPNGQARLSDCEVVRRFGDAAHAQAVAAWAASGHDDGRKSRVLALYGAAIAQAEGR
jgi:hypothetical protein